MVLIPNLTEVRPVNAIPVVAGLLLGPAGAWGCAVGNLVADLFGTFSIASVLGFLGNFAASYLPYKIWYMRGKGEAPNVKTTKNIGKFILIAALSSLCVATILSLGLDALNIVWGESIFIIVFLNDLGFSLFLGLPVFIVLTSDQINLRVVMPKSFSQGKNSQKIKVVLLLMVAISGIIVSLYIFAGVRLMQSWLMTISGIVFVVTSAAFMLRK